MNIPFDQKPFSEVSPELRPWLQDLADKAEADPSMELSRRPLPPGSTMEDAIIVSASILHLFPRAQNENFTPVDVEFVL